MKLEVLAETGERFTDFAPYVPSVNAYGQAAFQAATADGLRRVILAETSAEFGDAVCSHPDINDRGDLCWYADDGVYRHSEGRTELIAGHGVQLDSIGPLGPTMNASGVVAFRALLHDGSQAVCISDPVRVIAASGGAIEAFQGLPVINDRGDVLVRADLEDGANAIFVWRDGELQPIVKTGERLASLGNFPFLTDEGDVYFTEATRGVFRASGVGVDQILDSQGAYESFRGVLPHQHGFVHFATPVGGSLGVYSGQQRLFGIGDEVLGSVVTDMALNPVSIHASGVVVARLGFADGSGKIVRVQDLGR